MRTAVAAAIGLGAGVLSGAFGIGGGIITTPAIRLVLDAPALVAVGTPLPVIIPSAVTGAIQYLRRGSSDLRAGLILAAAGTATAVAGALLATRVGGTTVLLATAALIFWAAGDTIMQLVRPSAVAPDQADASVAPRTRVLLYIAVGALTGLYSGFFGLGGGFVVVPMLTRWAHFPIKRAIGTSLVVVTLLAVPGTVTHAFLGNVDWMIAAGLALGVVPGAYLGARITLGSADRVIRIGFATLLVVTGAWLAVNEIPGLLR